MTTMVECAVIDPAELPVDDLEDDTGVDDGSETQSRRRRGPWARRNQPNVGVRRYPFSRDAVAAVLRLSRGRRPDWFCVDLAAATLERYDVIDAAMLARVERGDLVLVTLNEIDVAHLRNFLAAPGVVQNRDAARIAIGKLRSALAK